MPLIEPGKKAPAFSLKDQNGRVHRLGDYAGRSVVLYFYPKDDTSGCTKEACSFNDMLPRFKSEKAAILGVSILDEASKARFATKYDLDFPLLADADHEVAEKYGVCQKRSLYGRSFMGIARTTYLIGADGKVKDAKVLRSIPLLDQAAVDAVKQWQFTPTLLNGVPVPVIMTVTVNFTLQ